MNIYYRLNQNHWKRIMYNSDYELHAKHDWICFVSWITGAVVFYRKQGS